MFGIRRREFITALGGAAVAWPMAARAAAATDAEDRAFVAALRRSGGAHACRFRQGLNELGWIEGQNFAFELRFADGNLDRLPQLADELVREKVDVIVTGSSPGASAAKNATSTIPIVMVTTGNPVQGGLIATLARPGGNVTGVTALGQVLNAKRLELLKEAVPSLKRVAILTNPASPYTDPFLQESEAAVHALGIEVRVLEAREPHDLERAFETIVNEHAEALMVLADPMFITHRRRIVELAAKNGCHPSLGNAGRCMQAASFPMAPASRHVPACCGLRRSILKGEKPGDLPVNTNRVRTGDQPQDREGARAGIALVAAARADEVIE